MHDGYADAADEYVPDDYRWLGLGSFNVNGGVLYRRCGCGRRVDDPVKWIRNSSLTRSICILRELYGWSYSKGTPQYRAGICHQSCRVPFITHRVFKIALRERPHVLNPPRKCRIPHPQNILLLVLLFVSGPQGPSRLYTSGITTRQKTNCARYTVNRGRYMMF